MLIQMPVNANQCNPRNLFSFPEPHDIVKLVNADLLLATCDEKHCVSSISFRELDDQFGCQVQEGEWGGDVLLFE